MVRCEEFYEKWKRDPNWCRKCASSVWWINRYIDLTERYPRLKQLSESALRPLLEKRLGDHQKVVAYMLSKEAEKGIELTPKLVKEFIRRYGPFTIVKKEARIEEIPRVEKRVLEAERPWKQRMAPPISRMEEAVAALLQKSGIRFLMSERIPVAWACPDFTIVKGAKTICVYLDGPPHAGREEKDAQTRGLLSRRGVTILEFRYGGYSQTQAELIAQDIIRYVRGV